MPRKRKKHEEFLISFLFVVVVWFPQQVLDDEKRNLFDEASDRAPECDRWSCQQLQSFTWAKARENDEAEKKKKRNFTNKREQKNHKNKWENVVLGRRSNKYYHFVAEAKEEEEKNRKHEKGIKEGFHYYSSSKGEKKKWKCKINGIFFFFHSIPFFITGPAPDGKSTDNLPLFVWEWVKQNEQGTSEIETCRSHKSREKYNNGVEILFSFTLSNWSCYFPHHICLPHDCRCLFVCVSMCFQYFCLHSRRAKQKRRF